MALRNRVCPYGCIQESPARGTLMGNRGILHDDTQEVQKTHAHQNWVACRLSFKGRKRQLMAPGNYTELFFLDEATAPAAGHRPCASCRREDYNRFVEHWKSVLGGPDEGRSMPQTIDRALHKTRITRRGSKVTFKADPREMPNGTFVSINDNACLLWDGRSLTWSFEGYSEPRCIPSEQVDVLTPEPLIAVLRAGYSPQLHSSIAIGN